MIFEQIIESCQKGELGAALCWRPRKHSLVGSRVGSKIHDANDAEGILIEDILLLTNCRLISLHIFYRFRRGYI